MSTFYDCDSTRISHREYWWGTRNPLVIIGWISKWLRIRIPSSTDDPNVESLTAFEISRADVPADVIARVQAVEEELRALGFHSPICHLIQDHDTHTLILMITMRNNSGMLGRVFLRHWSTPHPAKIYVAPQFITAFEDGTFLVSSALKADMLAPPECPVNRLEKASAIELLESHQQALITLYPSVPARRVTNDDQTRQVVEQFHALHRDFHIKRGVFVPRDREEEEVAEISPGGVTHPLAVTSDAEGGQPPPLPVAEPVLLHPETHAEIRKLQKTKSGGWGKAVITLVVTILIFAGAGAARWSWGFALALIPILFFHELGHYVVMKLFKYRNLKMFFIPMFGAAVTGRHYNVAGWKKALVSLAGPVPGIVAGAVIGVAGTILHQDWMLHGAFLMLILNGFNLLPVLPLDGGWVLHAVLFSRHYWLDTAFRVAAGLALLGGFMALDDRILMFLGIFTLMGVGANLKTGRITHAIRKQGLPTISPDAESIPAATADEIVTHLKGAFPKGVTAKNLAQMTLGIFESLNARPPGWLASAALLFTHLGSLVMAVVFAFFFVIARQGDVLDFLDMAVTAPQKVYQCNSLEEQRGSQFKDQPENAALTLIGNFADAEAAASAFTMLSTDLPAETGMRLFGQTLLVAVPTGQDALRASLVQRLEAVSTNVFAATTNLGWSVSINVVAPSVAVAEQLEEQIRNYSSIPGSGAFIPPWLPADPRNDEERARHELARKTYRLINERTANVYTNADYSALTRRRANALRQGDATRAKSIDLEARALLKKLRDEVIDQMRAETDVHDPEILRLYTALPEIEDEESAKLHTEKLGELTVRMGLLADLPAPASGSHLAFAAGGGFPRRTGQVIRLDYSRHDSAYHGVPALAQWLCDQGCIDLQYEFVSFTFADFDDEDLEE